MVLDIDALSGPLGKEDQLLGKNLRAYATYESAFSKCKENFLVAEHQMENRLRRSVIFKLFGSSPTCWAVGCLSPLFDVQDDSFGGEINFVNSKTLNF